MANIVVCQNNLNLRGQLLIDKKVIVGSLVTVYNENSIISQTSTDELGKFWINLRFQKVYVVQFKKRGLPIQKVVISTENKNLPSDFSKSKVIVFSFLSSQQSKEGPETSGAIASYSVDSKGILMEDQIAVIEPIRIKDDNEKVIEDKIKVLENKTEDIISDLPDKDKVEQNIDYELIKRKKDSILFFAELEAELILKSAQKQAESISIQEENVILKQKSEKKGMSKTRTEIKSDLKKLAVEEKTFYEREDIKSYQETIDKLKDKEKMSKRDSFELLNSMVLINEEMVESARLQLEIDKLSARTVEDSIRLQERETAIRFAEQEITEAKNKIEIQQLEIQQKNIWLLFAGSALLFFIILSIVVYRSFRDKQRTNIILEKNNQEIANKNKKIIDSIRYAQTIQQAILPIKSAIDKYFDWFIIFQPKDIVSGDFYWFDHFEEKNKSVFAVVDCTGHGVPGAFMSMIGNRLLIEAVKEKGISKPVDILDKIDASIRVALMQEETSNNDGMDMCVCSIEYLDNDKCRVDFAGAKRPFFYSDGKDGMKHIKGTIRSIGGKKRIREKAVKPFEEHSLILDKGEMIYLTTDGFFDLQSPSRKKFGRVNFIDLLNEHHKKNLFKQKEVIMDALHLHKGSEYQIDDITILGIRL
jgi:serine phosphatase RsbU (regulator of sigma subunit)